MSLASGNAEPSQATLFEIIRTQTEIAQLGHDSTSVMQRVCHRVEMLTQADGAAIELADNGDMVYRAATGLAEAQLGLRLQQPGNLSGLSVQMDQILNCRDSETDPRVNRSACRKIGLRSMLVVPLSHNSMPVGVLKVMSVEPDTFSDAEIRASP